MAGAEDEEGSLEAEAAAWVVSLAASRVTSADLERFESWRRTSSAHEAAFAFAQRTWRDFDGLREHAPEEAVSHRTQAAHARLRNKISSSHASSSRFSFAGLYVAAAGLAIMLGIIVYIADPLPLLRADYRTAKGDTLEVLLPDHSTAQLNTNSALAVQYSPHERRVEVLEGEIAFAVMKDKSSSERPFVVAAEGGESRALGTRYLVRRDGDAVEVTVVAHRVQVTAKSDAAMVDASHAVDYDADQGLGTIRKVDLRAVTAWQRGWLMFDQVALSQVVAEINRYRRGILVIADEKLARRAVSGAFRTDDLDKALTTIVAELDLGAFNVTPFLTILY